MLRSIDISPDGETLVSNTAENVFSWHLSESTPSPSKLPEGIAGYCLRFSNNGDQLAMPTDPPGVLIVDARNWNQLFTFRHANGVEHVSWSNEDRRIAAANINATTHLWDLSTEQIVTTFKGTVAEFSPNGTILDVAGQGSKFIGDEEHVGRVTLHYAPPLEEIDTRLAAREKR